ncbi:MAG: glycosyltransferase family 39 protein, partial [Acidobacteriota bacterium]|nr:glycosyltransferase family 39 protein [Acidobacteriota bacterium]
FLVGSFALSGRLPLWLDEILQLTETRRASPTAMIASLPQFSGAAPLGYLVQQASLRLTGYSVRMARLPSIIFGAAAVFLTALLGAELGLKYSWQAAALFAVFPFTLRYATESRIYSMALFLSVLASYLYVRFARRPSWTWACAHWLTRNRTRRA